MAVLSLQTAADIMKGRIINGLPVKTFSGYHLDSRLIRPRDLFFAVMAKRDGHEFISDAAKNGALGAVVAKTVDLPGKEFGLILVNDTIRALQDLAHGVRTRSGIKVVGITGSIGKTTTKHFASYLLSQKYSLLQSEGNFNNHLGLPLTLLRLAPDHDIALLEMAMSARGEIADLTRIAKPDVAVITNIHPVHLEFFNSTMDIALAKKEILDTMDPGGTAVLNEDDPLVRKISQDWKGQRILFGLSPSCDISAEEIKKDSQSGLKCRLRYGNRNADIRLPFVYDSHLNNFLAATAAAYSLDLELDHIVEAAGSLQPPSNRGRFYHLKNNIHLIDDSYNSSPAALESALQSLSTQEGTRKIAVLGDMLELGPDEKDFHIATGIQVQEMGWDILVTVGTLGQHTRKGALKAGMAEGRMFSFQTSEEAAGRIGNILEKGDLVLVKGSRGIRMEKIVKSIKEEGF